MLKLNDLVDSNFGISFEDFTTEGITANKFVTVKEFIDNPDTVEMFRFNNSYGGIKFHNEVYEYLDSKFFPKTEQIVRKAARNGIVKLN